MEYRRLDEIGDYTFGRGTQDYITGAQAVAQAVKTRLKLLLGEWWEDTSDGLPLFENILGVRGTQNNISSADNLIRQRILETEGVSNIITIISNFQSSSRTYSVHAELETLYGNVTVEVNI